MTSQSQLDGERNHVRKSCRNKQHPGPFGIDRMYIYYLTDELELKDSIGPYRKSMLYFVSRSFEEKIPAKILEMEKDLKDEIKPKLANLKLIVSKGSVKLNPKTASETHGGFDNDFHAIILFLRLFLRLSLRLSLTRRISVSTRVHEYFQPRLILP